MIYVNGEKVDIKHFPDGTQMLFEAGIEKVVKTIPERGRYMYFVFKWIYENDEEMITIMYLLKHYREVIKFPYDVLTRYRLIMSYLPNARMDRTKEVNEVFTLKYFCDFINSLNFDEVIVLDPHSNVSVALLNNLIVESPEPFIKYAIDDIEGRDIDGGRRYKGCATIYFPDEGAMKRYKDLKVFGDRKIVYGKKNRDWKTGKILGLNIVGQDGTPLSASSDKPLDNAVVLMIDDIVSYGGTLAYSADKLRELGASAVYAYASHVENSILDEEKGTLLKRLNDGTVDELFTTPSLYQGEHPRIKVIDEL
jgi:ribose-phosphate pyrophosphokinase